MSFLNRRNPWNPGYAMPGYVLAEPAGRGTFTTKWLQRGTISQLVPDELSGLGSLGSDGMGSLSGNVFGAAAIGTKKSSPLLSALRPSKPGFKGDPIAAYGMRVSEVLMGRIRRVPKVHRKAALKAVLDELDVSLWERVADKAQQFKAKGHAPKAAMRKAIASAVSSGMAKEILAAGRKGAVPLNSQMGLGMYGREACKHVCAGVRRSLGAEEVVVARRGEARTPEERAQIALEKIGDGSSAHPWKFANITRDHRTAGNVFQLPAMQSAWNKAVSAASKNAMISRQLVGALNGGILPFATFENVNMAGEKWGLYWNGTTLTAKPVPPKKGLWDAVKSIGKGIAGAAKAAYDFAKDTVGKIGGLACAALTNDAVGLAAGVAATAYGAPPQVATVGVQVAKGVCAKKETPAATQEDLLTPEPAKGGGGALALIAGAGALALLAL